MYVVSAGDVSDNGMKMSTTSAGSCAAILSKTPVGLLPLTKLNLMLSHLTCRRQCI